MYNKQSIKQSFGRAASGYEHNALLQRKVREKALAIAQDFFSPDAIVLDIGCGPVPIAGWKVIGLDIAYGMCAVAGKNNLVINGDGSSLPFTDGSFDAVFSSLFMQWAEDPEKVIAELLRVLKPRGSAVITTFTDGTLRELKEAFTAMDSAPHVNDFLSSEQLYNTALRLGGQVMLFEEHSYVEEYEGVISLMRSIKSIGASNKLEGRSKSLMTPAQFKKMDKAYDKLDGIVEATWNVLTLAIGKA